MAAKLGGKTGGKYGLGQNSDINVTPFVDVMLVLLIIFMVSIPAATLAVKIDLPPATPDQAHEIKKPVYISIQSDSQIDIVDTPTSLDNLVTDLSGAEIRNGSANPKNDPVLIRANKDVHYEAFMSVINKLQSEGYYKVSLITENL
ncbi:ExbD/TolR family protein [Phenylobacterium montanum]|uniref:Biopolymer transporter ExbD n=1 Tax=Phenylobacterium montanum TaxID=2823693 RepID=A0A975FX35_9CAUL|nr:biopolymer transporter ExbD [Caulobacter sp. S6]QUD86559.1 biopolymer transporter ExbD [Caulobacter sp. S6]